MDFLMKEKEENQMQEQIAMIKQNALNEIANAKDAKQLEEVRVKYLGKKGELTLILRGMGGLSQEERPISLPWVHTIRELNVNNSYAPTMHQIGRAYEVSPFLSDNRWRLMIYSIKLLLYRVLVIPFHSVNSLSTLPSQRLA